MHDYELHIKGLDYYFIFNPRNCRISKHLFGLVLHYGLIGELNLDLWCYMRIWFSTFSYQISSSLIFSFLNSFQNWLIVGDDQFQPGTDISSILGKTNLLDTFLVLSVRPQLVQKINGTKCESTDTIYFYFDRREKLQKLKLQWCKNEVIRL